MDHRPRSRRGTRRSQPAWSGGGAGLPRCSAISRGCEPPPPPQDRPREERPGREASSRPAGPGYPSPSRPNDPDEGPLPAPYPALGTALPSAPAPRSLIPILPSAPTAWTQPILRPLPEPARNLQTPRATSPFGGHPRSSPTASSNCPLGDPRPATRAQWSGCAHASGPAWGARGPRVRPGTAEGGTCALRPWGPGSQVGICRDGNSGAAAFTSRKPLAWPFAVPSPRFPAAPGAWGTGGEAAHCSLCPQRPGRRVTRGGTQEMFDGWVSK